MSTLLLITSAPTSIHAWHALGLAQALQQKSEAFRVFFYQDGVAVANELQWAPDDQRNLKTEWQKLSIRLPAGFELVGLGELADAVQSTERLIQF